MDCDVKAYSEQVVGFTVTQLTVAFYLIFTKSNKLFFSTSV